MPTALPLTTMIAETSNRNRAYKTKSAAFGNGYAQVAPDGINNVKDTWSITYENLTSAERTTLLAVLDAVQSWDIITWTAPGDGGSKNWRMTPDGWSEVTDGLHYTISLKLEQCY